MTSRCSRPRRAGTPPTGSCPGKNPGGGGSKRTAHRKKTADAPAGKQSAARGGRKPEGKKGGEAKPAAAQSPRRSGGKSRGAQPGGQPVKGAQRPSARKSSSRRGLPKRPPNLDNRAHQKDSTEQNSLMKPYYLSDLKKR